MTVFSAHNLLSSPRDVILTNPGEDLGFNLIGDSPVTITNLSEQAKVKKLNILTKSSSHVI